MLLRTCFVLHIVCFLVEFGGVDHVVRFAQKGEIQQLILHVEFFTQSNGVAVGLSAREEMDGLRNFFFAYANMGTKNISLNCSIV